MGAFDTSTAIGREALLVELVDEFGNAIGSDSVAQAHRLPGRLHRAFSVLLFDTDGQVLLQRRAAVKTRFPQRWSNTCCGHPMPGQDVVAAATVRLKEELGCKLDTFITAGVYRYRAVDTAGAQEEHEWDHVLTAVISDPTLTLTPDPVEVSECAWMDPMELRDRIAREPEDYTPWLLGVLDVAIGFG